jgi:alpha-tubulin suppressor-like RCC1 family protein
MHIQASFSSIESLYSMKTAHKILAALTATAVLVSIPVSAQAGEIPRSGAYAWGSNSSGSLGTGTVNSTVSPTLTKTFSNFPIAQTSTSATHSLFTDDKGNVYASGSNTHGELGDGTTTNSSIPVKVTLPLRYGVPDYATQIWAGDGVSFMEGGFGDLYAWGSNENGLTGLGKTTGDTLTPTSVGLSLMSSESKSLSVGKDHVTAIHTDSDFGDQMYAWGSNATGQLGNATLGTGITPRPTRAIIPDPFEDQTKTVTTCTTDAEGSESCEDTRVPKTYYEFTGLNPNYVANGDGFSVALTSDGTIYTWGKNNAGQLGTASPQSAIVRTPTTSPALQLENGASVNSISAGDSHVVLLASNGLLYGWGSNSDSQTAPYYESAQNASYLPVLQRLTILQENNSLSPWEYVIASGNSSYAVTNDGNIYGWGDNSKHQLTQFKSTVTVPTKIAFPYDTEVNSFTAGGGNVIALTNYTETYTDLNLPTTTFASGTYNTAYTQKLTANGGYPGNQLSWTVSGLPAGLTYNALTGTITGIPTVAGTYTINYGVTDNVDSLTDSATLVIAKATPTVTPTYTSTMPGKVTAKVSVLNGTTTATGAVRFYVGTKYTTVNLSKGVATTTLSYTAGSTQSLKVVYVGNSVLNSVTTSAKSVKSLAKWSVTPAPSYSTKSRTVTVKVPAIKSGSVNATGSIYLYDGSKKIVSGSLKNGATTFSKSLAKGTHKLTVRYAGDANFNAKNSAAKSITLK